MFPNIKLVWIICIHFQPADEGSQTLLNRYLDIIDLFRDEIILKASPYFACWVMHKILLLEIANPSEQEAHTIFITMNDRELSATLLNSDKEAST